MFDKIHPTLRDVTLFNEVLNKTGQPYRVTIGAPIMPADLPRSSDEAILALRQAVLSLPTPGSNRDPPDPQPRRRPPDRSTAPRRRPDCVPRRPGGQPPDPPPGACARWDVNVRHVTMSSRWINAARPG